MTRPPPGGARLPPAVRAALAGNADAFGSAPVWVLLRPARPHRLRGGQIRLELVLVVSGSGAVRIVGRPLDGGAGRVWSDVATVPQNGAPHPVVTSITVSHACWDVAAVFRGNAVQWVIDAVSGSPSR